MSFVKFRLTYNDVEIGVHNLIENLNHVILKIGFNIIQPLYLSKNIFNASISCNGASKSTFGIGVVHFSCLIRFSRYFILFKWVLLQTRGLRFSISAHIQILLRLWIVAKNEKIVHCYGILKWIQF